MAFYNDGYFGEYVPVAARRAQAQDEVRRLKKTGRKVSPVRIEGRAIATTFWGKSWCENLEAYSDFANRLPRGRTYARNGSVIDLQIEKGRVTALVSGSDIYSLSIDVTQLPAKRWKPVVSACAGKIDSVVELLTGRLSQGVMELLCRQDKGLFPTPTELELSCSCPDGAWLCKHLAAALYGVGARLDHEPELLFVLRGVEKMDLISEAGSGGALAAQARGATSLERDSLSELFGIELAETAPAPAAKPRRAPRKRKAKSKPPRVTRR